MPAAPNAIRARAVTLAPILLVCSGLASVVPGCVQGGDPAEVRAEEALQALPAVDVKAGILAVTQFDNRWLDADSGAEIIEVDWRAAHVEREVDAETWAADSSETYEPLTPLAVCDHLLGRPGTDCLDACPDGDCLIRDPASELLVFRDAATAQLREAGPAPIWLPRSSTPETSWCSPADRPVEAAWIHAETGLIAAALTPRRDPGPDECHVPVYPVLLVVSAGGLSADTALRINARMTRPRTSRPLSGDTALDGAVVALRVTAAAFFYALSRPSLARLTAGHARLQAHQRFRDRRPVSVAARARQLGACDPEVKCGVGLPNTACVCSEAGDVGVLEGIDVDGDGLFDLWVRWQPQPYERDWNSAVSGFELHEAAQTTAVVLPGSATVVGWGSSVGSGWSHRVTLSEVASPFVSTPTLFSADLSSADLSSNSVRLVLGASAAAWSSEDREAHVALGTDLLPVWLWSLSETTGGELVPTPSPHLWADATWGTLEEVTVEELAFSASGRFVAIGLTEAHGDCMWYGERHEILIWDTENAGVWSVTSHWGEDGGVNAGWPWETNRRMDIELIWEPAFQLDPGWSAPAADDVEASPWDLP